MVSELLYSAGGIIVKLLIDFRYDKLCDKRGKEVEELNKRLESVQNELKDVQEIEAQLAIERKRIIELSQLVENLSQQNIELTSRFEQVQNEVKASGQFKQEVETALADSRKKIDELLSKHAAEKQQFGQRIEELQNESKQAAAKSVEVQNERCVELCLLESIQEITNQSFHDNLKAKIIRYSLTSPF
jgi:DNA repair exonuclease SbcCD ATPase subunit